MKLTKKQQEAVDKAFEVLNALDWHFDEGAYEAYAHSQLFDDERTLQQKVAGAVDAMSTAFGKAQ